MRQCNQICSFCHRSAIKVDLEDLESGYVNSETLGAHRKSIREIENGVAQGQVDDILGPGMRYNNLLKIVGS
jgi:wyosine [tRNA(Phe)-imidazoG37] synthetase (radical SAM superfamily)